MLPQMIHLSNENTNLDLQVIDLIVLTCLPEQLQDIWIPRMHTRLCQETRLCLIPVHPDKLFLDMIGLVQL